MGTSEKRLLSVLVGAENLKRGSMSEMLDRAVSRGNWGES